MSSNTEGNIMAHLTDDDQAIRKGARNIKKLEASDRRMAELKAKLAASNLSTRA